MNLTHMLGDLLGIEKYLHGVGYWLNEALNFIGWAFYAIFTGVGMLIDFVLSLFKRFAGIEEMELMARYGEKTYAIKVGGEGNWTDITYAFITSEAVRTTFWTIFAMCIALLVVFTIFAIVKSEFSTDVKNAAKLPILERAVKSVINFLLIPVLSLASLYGANMLTKAVYYSFNTSSEYYITNVVFNAGATQANRAALDDGFANFLLASDTVYFAREDHVKPFDAMSYVLNTYYAKTGNITIEKCTKGAGWTEENLSDFTVENIGTFSLTTDVDELIGYKDSDPYGVYAVISEKDKYYAKQGSPNTAGYMYYLPNVEYQKGHAYWYVYRIQAPVTIQYLSQEEGFQQKISTIAWGGMGSEDAYKIRALSVESNNMGRYVIQASRSVKVFGEKYEKTVITADDVTSWETDDNGLRFCVSLEDSMKEYIAAVATDYMTAIKSLTQKEAAKSYVTLWDVLHSEYDVEGENPIFGLVKPSKTKESIQAISKQQREKLVEFINRIFVGYGDGTGAYCKRVKEVNGQGTISFMTDEERKADLEKDIDEQNIDVSSATLHIEKSSFSQRSNEQENAEGWTYTVDWQQQFWSPSVYSGEAVMDIGLVGYFYKFNNMNLVMMLFGMVAIAWQYFKLILVFVKRALEMVLLFLMAPVVTAIAPLDKGNAENSWRSNWIKQLTMTAVPVFAINIFFTIVPLVTSIAPFGTTVGSIINPLHLTYNAFVSIIFIYVGVSMINRASQLLAGFLGTEDMIAQGKDLTGKATGVVGTAAKGAALVTGVALAGPAAAIKLGLGGISGKRAANASRAASRKAALSDIDDQIKEAKEAGDSDRVFQLERYRDNYDAYKANSAGGQQFSKAQKDKALEKLGAAQKAKESDEADLAKLRAEQESLASVPMQMGRQKKWNAEEKKAWEDKKADIEAQIAQKQSDIAEKNATIADAQRQAQYYANDERFYSGFSAADEMAKDARKNGVTIDGKKYIGSKARREKSLVEDIREVQKGYDKTIGKFMKETPIIKSTVGGAVNWAVDKMLLGSLGVVGQVADRKFSDVPKNLTDFVSGIDKTGGGILERVLDPGKLGKDISTADENKKRETQKEEKTRAEIWEENAKREKEKMKAEEKAMADMKKKEETMQQLRDWETYKMGGFNITGDKVNVNTDRNETVAKNYKSVIDKRAEEDYKKEVHKTDKDFEKFKQMLKEMEDENKKKAQNVKIDPRDKGFGEQVIKAMKKINAQSNRELKNINSGIASLTKTIQTMIDKMS